MREREAVSAYEEYSARLQAVLRDADWTLVEQLGSELLGCWREKRQVFICGNGGSAGNAMHLANDFVYGISKRLGEGLRIHALSANPSVITCLANDEGYEHIYSAQLGVQANAGDVLIVLSGSGNSANIVNVLAKAKELRVRSYAILGYAGGKAKALADVSIHFPVEDMQISEDLQLVVGHMIMQWLYTQRPKGK